MNRRRFTSLLGKAALLPTLAALDPRRAAAEDGGTGDLAALVRLQASTPATALDARTKVAVAGTLARLDSLPFDHARGRVVLVNIAAAEVIAYQDGMEALRSKAIVGTGRTRTPQLASPVPSIRLNPPWYVPPSIEPQLRAAGAPGFRSVNGRLVLPPGPRNPLGPVRIGLEGSDGVFLHGTSEPRLFAREGRTLSHGCVRVERIIDLAAWMLDMPPEALRAAIATGRTRELVPSEAVRAALLYLTAWPGEDGRLVLHPDPYGLDRTTPRPIPRPAPRPALPDPAVGEGLASDQPAA